MSPDERRSTGRPGIRRESETLNDPDHSQFLEPTDQNPSAGYGGPLRRRDDRPASHGGAAGGGTGAIGAGTYYGEGEESEHHGEAAWADEKLRDEIREQLTHHPNVPGGEVEVLVEGGEVTLQGTVEDRDIRWLVEDLVEAVSGVSLVHNRLRVARS